MFVEGLSLRSGFWRPLAWFEPNEDTDPIEALFPPWLVLYIAVYVVIMFATKAALRIA